jgi:hypothetical protein
MEAREIAEMLKDAAESDTFTDGTTVDTDWGHGEADFFLEVDGTRFLVTVAQVSA